MAISNDQLSLGALMAANRVQQSAADGYVPTRIHATEKWAILFNRTTTEQRRLDHLSPDEIQQLQELYRRRTGAKEPKSTKAGESRGKQNRTSKTANSQPRTTSLSNRTSSTRKSSFAIQKNASTPSETLGKPITSRSIDNRKQKAESKHDSTAIFWPGRRVVAKIFFDPFNCPNERYELPAIPLKPCISLPPKRLARQIDPTGS